MQDFDPVNRYDLEYTDTFGGEANYCWVKRRVLTLSLADGDDAKARKRYDARVKREAKAAMGLTGIRGEWNNTGGDLEFRPRNMCTVLFVSWHDCGAHSRCDHGHAD
ncbi:MAG: hypothetical protein EBZ75_11500 [Oxalobacteraceae bacterium]|nr:hypothetical protein [Oxalobacteraceae bacterium]